MKVSLREACEAAAVDERQARAAEASAGQRVHAAPQGRLVAVTHRGLAGIKAGACFEAASALAADWGASVWTQDREDPEEGHRGDSKEEEEVLHVTDLPILVMKITQADGLLSPCS